MRFKGRQSDIWLWSGLASTAALLYVLYYAILGDARLVLGSIVGNVAFIPVQIALVTLTIQRLLNAREKCLRLEKLNMVIGAFFSEVGVELLTSIVSLDTGLEGRRKDLLVSAEWTGQSFSQARRRLKGYEFRLQIGTEGLVILRELLRGKIRFLLHQLENPNLLEHESFSELLRAVLHLAEEFSYRDDISKLPHSDCDHLGGDVARIYGQLARHWLDYMEYLKDHYPYLFSLAIRTNPFNPDASPVVR